MRDACPLFLGLLAGCLAGCATPGPDAGEPWTSRFRGFQGPTGPDVVCMHVHRVERPIDDEYLGRTLWKAADEQVVGLEAKAVLEQNGFRVGQIGGNTPAGLLKLVTNTAGNADSRGRLMRAGNQAFIEAGPRLAVCRYQVTKAGGPTVVELVDAVCVLAIVPSLAEDGRVRLRFTPQVRHGEPVPNFRPAADGKGWTNEAVQPVEVYPELGWEVTLAPNECVVVGGRADRPGTLGHRCFFRANEPFPVQRLLVLRAGAAAAGSGSDDTAESEADFSLLSKSPPIAAQASLTGVRARPR